MKWFWITLRLGKHFQISITLGKEVQEKDLRVSLLPASAFWKIGALAVFSACPNMELLEYIFQLETH